MASVVGDRPSIFEPYPDGPGYQARETSKAAAAGIAPEVKSLRERVLEALKRAPGTPEEVARRIGAPVMNVRPRATELSKKGLIRDSGKRGKATGGRRAIVWEVAA